MKKVFLLITMSVSAFLVKAQKYEDIKNKLILSMYKPAREELDKAMTNAKFTSKAEAYILKTTVYAGMALTDAVKNTPEATTLMTEAELAFKKYREMEPGMTLLADPVYQNAPVSLYSGYYTMGYNDYTAKSWESSFDKFQKAVELSDLLISKKIMTASVDTNVLVLAAITAENSKNKDEAAKYYQRLADAKVTGEGYESVYRYLVTYYFAKKDIPAFEKYKAMGQEMFPKSDFFTYDKIDFAVGLEENFDAKMKALEAMLAADPDNNKANQILGELIYDTLNSHKEGAALPANAAELEKRMILAFNKSGSTKADAENPYLFMGDHFINKAVKVNEAREAHAAAMKTRTKPGTMSSKEDLAKRDLLDKEYGEALEGARDPYEKAAAIFAARGTLDNRTKLQYKKAANYLIDIYAFKKIQAKGKPADQAKFAAEEKKWTERYDSIK